MYTDDDEIGRAVAADLEECWQGEGWYRICFTDGMGSYPATWYGTQADLADDLRGAYGDAGEIHLPYAEISVIDQAVEKVWQGEGWYRVTGGDGEKWEPDFYVTRECLVAALRDAYDEASFSGAICVPRVEPAPDPNRPWKTPGSGASPIHSRTNAHLCAYASEHLGTYMATKAGGSAPRRNRKDRSQ